MADRGTEAHREAEPGRRGVSVGERDSSGQRKALGMRDLLAIRAALMLPRDVAVLRLPLQVAASSLPHQPLSSKPAPARLDTLFILPTN